MNEPGAVELLAQPVLRAVGGAYEAVDIQDESELELFETHFYQAFFTRPQQRLLREVWIWDDERGRLRLRTPYANTMLYKWTDDEGHTLAYAAGGGRLPCFSQIGYFGFELPGFCRNHLEIFTLFINPQISKQAYRLNKDFLKPLYHFTHIDCGYDYMCATCADQLLPLYLKWGWQLFETKFFADEKRHLLILDLASQCTRPSAL